MFSKEPPVNGTHVPIPAVPYTLFLGKYWRDGQKWHMHWWHLILKNNWTDYRNRMSDVSISLPRIFYTELTYACVLTHLSLDKMAAILADDIFKGIFLNETDKIPIQISLKLVPRSPIDNKSALVRVMAWRRTGDKPLPEPMMSQFTDAYMRHSWLIITISNFPLVL